jgi:hypothetical protein
VELGSGRSDSTRGCRVLSGLVESKGGCCHYLVVGYQCFTESYCLHLQDEVRSLEVDRLGSTMGGRAKVLSGPIGSGKKWCSYQGPDIGHHKCAYVE